MSDDMREFARKTLKSKNDFKIMAVVFAVVTVLLVAIWFVSGYRAYFWPIWPILGFVIALAFAGLDAYGITRRRITEADIDAEVERMNTRRRP